MINVGEMSVKGELVELDDDNRAFDGFDDIIIDCNTLETVVSESINDTKEFSLHCFFCGHFQLEFSRFILRICNKIYFHQ
jgi:hypothetical protein